MDSERLLISKREAAYLLGVSLRTIENLIARKELIPRRVGRRVLIPRQALEQFARRDHATQPAVDDSPARRQWRRGKGRDKQPTRLDTND